MRSIVLTVVAAGVLFVVFGTCLLGCGGRVDSKYRPTTRIETWSNAEWAAVLDQLVTPDGYVRHDQLARNEGGVRDRLYRYVGLINAAGPKNRPELFPTESDKLAYYMNAYNALCMYAVVQRNFPKDMKTSGIFFLDRFPVGGDSMTLDYLEKTYLRPVDPRIHFAINCMSASCPPLRREPYEPAKVDAQLDEQGRIFLSDPRGAYLKGETAVLSEIFRFFTSDFTDAHAKATGQPKVELLDSIRKFAADDSPVQSAKTYEFQKYDWSLNRPPVAK